MATILHHLGNNARCFGFGIWRLGFSVLSHFTTLLGCTLLGLDPLFLSVVLSLLEELRLRVSIFSLNLVQILFLTGILLLRRVLYITVSLLSLTHLLHSLRLLILVLTLTTFALATERTLLLRRTPWAPIHRARLILVHLILRIVV